MATLLRKVVPTSASEPSTCAPPPVPAVLAWNRPPVMLAAALANSPPPRLSPPPTPAVLERKVVLVRKTAVVVRIPPPGLYDVLEMNWVLLIDVVPTARTPP